MQWFWDVSAQVYFWAMTIPLGWMVVIHLICLRNLNVYPLHMNETLRVSARDMHGWMAYGAASMIWMMWAFLPWMNSICATAPWIMLSAHAPCMVASWGRAINGTNHLKLQLDAIRAL